MNRRTLIGAAAAVAALPLLNRVASAQTSPKTNNVVFVHGLFADGSCWSKVIARLQQKGVNCTSVQNPLTSLHEASEAARRAITFDQQEPSANSPCTNTTFFVFGDVWALATRLSKGSAAPAATAPINVRRFIMVSC